MRQRAAENNAVTVRPVSKKHWNQDLEICRQLLNETFKEEWSFTYTREECHEFCPEIAAALFISMRTVEHHRAHICEKLDLRGFNALVKFALAHKSEFS